MEELKSQRADAQNDHASEKHQVAQGIWGLKDKFVNVYFVETGRNNEWVLIDAGLSTSKDMITKFADQHFNGSAPVAIVLTHGHFDHIGSVIELAHLWKVPVYAHYLELPYLTGKSSYPPPDPGVGGGLMSLLSPFYKRTPIDLGAAINALPEEETVPFMPGWKFIHTPGHAPGHISLFRDEDRVLIAGDAFVTTKPESLLSTITQRKKISGPPMYFTTDWDAAEQSVKKLVALDPLVVATGHGQSFSGDEMRSQLNQLATNFRDEAIPSTGRYVNEPAVADASGTLYVPPKYKNRRNDNLVLAGLMIGTFVISAALTYAIKSRR